MLDRQSSPNCSSYDFEKAALARFRFLATSLPQSCVIYRETWGTSTVLHLDFQACPTQLNEAEIQQNPMIIAARQLSLASSIIFKLGNKIIGWTKINSSE